MAAEYIPIRHTLTEDPAVLSLADTFGIADEDLIVGKLARFWIWCSEQTCDGKLHGISAQRLDRVVRLDGFADALCALKPHPWLLKTPDGFEIPNWDHWLSDSAKARQGETIAKRIQRKNRPPDPAPECPDNVRTQSPHSKSKSRQQRAESESKNSLQQCSAPGTPTDPEASAQPPAAPIAALSNRGEVCSLLFALRDWAGLPLFDANAAAAIAAHPRATVEQVTWAIGRFKQRTKTEAGKRFKSSASAWLRGMIERNEPPDGWAEEFRRKQIRQIAARNGAA